MGYPWLSIVPIGISWHPLAWPVFFWPWELWWTMDYGFGAGSGMSQLMVNRMIYVMIGIYLRYT
jgi:hypothetical protein